jgi:hypothetical protein
MMVLTMRCSILLKAFAVCLISASAATWYYQAQKFDSIAKEQLDLFFQKHSAYLSYNAVEVDKYLFKVILKDVNIKPVAVKFDEVVVRHIPLLQVTRLNFPGKAHILDAVTQQELLYSTNENSVFWFTRPIFNQDNLNWDMSGSFDKTTYFDSKTNKKLYEAINGKTTFKHAEKANNIIALDSHNDYTNILENKELDDLLQKAGLSILEKHNYKSTSQPVNYGEDINNIINQLYALSFPSTIKLNFHLEYDKEIYNLTKKVIASNFDKTLSAEFANYFSKDFIVNGSYHDQDANYIGAINFDFTKKGQMSLKVDSTIKTINNSVSEEKISDVIYEHGVPVVQKYLPKFAATKQQVKDLLSPLFKFDNLTWKMEINEVNKDNYKGAINYNLDGNELDIKGEILKDAVSMQVAFSKPKVFISSTLDYLDQKASPVIAQIVNMNYKTPAGFEKFKKSAADLVDVIDNDGNADEKLEMEVTYSKKDAWKINNKTTDTLLQDPKSTEFSMNLMELMSVDSNKKK